jgi:hypothetical protein
MSKITFFLNQKSNKHDFLNYFHPHSFDDDNDDDG